MPQIPVYEQRTAARGTAPSASSGTGEGLQALGQAFESIADNRERVRQFARQKEEESASVAANLELADTQSSWSEQFSKRQEGVQPGAVDFEKTILADFDKDTAERLKRAQTPLARTHLQLRFAAVRQSLQEQARGFEAQERVRFKETGLSDARDLRRKTAEFNPGQFSTLATEQLAAIEASGLPAPIASRHAKQAVEDIAEASVRGMIRQDPRNALRELSNEGSTVQAVRALNADDLLRLRSSAEAEVSRRDSEARARAAQARGDIADRQTDALAAKQFGLPATLPSRREYIAAFGAEEGSRRFGQASQMLSTFDVVSAAVILPPAEGAARIASFAPQQQAGAADQAQVVSAAARMYAEQRKQLEDDPAGFLAKRDPTLRQAFEAAFAGDATPETVSAYVQRARAAQAASGVQKPRLLPEGTEAAVAAALTLNPEKPAQRSENLAALSQAWGRNLPQLLAEVAPKLDGQARAMLLMDLPDAARFDRAAAAAAETKKLFEADEALKPKGKTAEAAIDAALRPLATSLNNLPDRNERLTEIREAALVIARDAITRGSAPADAARQAVDSMVGRYEFDGAARIPREQNPQTVMAGARKALAAGLPGVDLLPPEGLRFRSADEMRTAVQADLRRRGVWMTAPDESGLQLYVPRGDTLAPVLTAAGTPVRLSWEALTQSGAEGEDSREITRRAAADPMAGFGPGLGEPR